MHSNLLILSCLLLLSHILYGQHPYYYQLTTEDGLPTNEVYDLMQDSKGYFWVATDNGLARYDGETFSSIPTSVNINQSFTNLFENSEGQIWCFGFPANIMYVENDTLHRLINFASNTRSYPTITLDSNDILSISGDYGIFRYNTLTKNWIDSNQLRLNYVYSLYFYTNKVYADPYLVEEYYADLEGISYVSPPYSLDKIKKNGLFKKFNDKLLYVYNLNFTPSLFFEIRNDSAIAISKINEWINCRRVISPFLYKDSILFFGTVNGLKGIDRSYKSALKNTLLPKLSVSSVFIDSEENLWTSTTQQGLCIFPNFNNQLYSSENSNLQSNDISRLTSDGQYLYIGLKNGTIQRLSKENQFETIFESLGNNVFISLMEYNPFRKELIFAEGNIYSYHTPSGLLSKSSKLITLSANDISFASNNEILFSTSKKSSFVDFNLNQTSINKWSKHTTLKLKYYNNRNDSCLISLIKQQRSLCNAYNPITDTYWIGYNEGIYSYKNYKEQAFTFKGKAISAFDIAVSPDGSTWIASTSGLHQVDVQGNKHNISIADGLYNNSVEHVICEKNILYLIFREGFQAYNYLNKEFKTFTKTDGLPSSDIQDIQVFDNKIYVATAKGLVAFPLDYNPINYSPPKLNITGFYINDRLQDRQASYTLRHQQNNIHITFDIIAYRSLGNYKLKYRLNGNNEEWLVDEKPSKKLRFSNLKSGTYTLEMIGINEDNIPSPVQSIKFQILPPFYQTWWFWLLVVFGTSLLSYLFYQIRIQTIQKNAAIKQQLIGSEMKAIKSQMNPHFIFNALNSIQDLILKKDTRASNKYLVKFSLLIRKVLKLSSKELISVEEELELLKVYVELEQLRFGEDLSYTISYEVEDYDDDELLIQPLIVQPYVENCFKHGLLHKEGQKVLSIQFELKNQKLFCTIEDNGIGRKKSKEINLRRSDKNHQSFATEANQKRIDLINATQEQNIDLKIIDLPNHSGTKVEIGFPILLK